MDVSTTAHANNSTQLHAVPHCPTLSHTAFSQHPMCTTSAAVSGRSSGVKLDSDNLKVDSSAVGRLENQEQDKASIRGLSARGEDGLSAVELLKKPNILPLNYTETQ